MEKPLSALKRKEKNMDFYFTYGCDGTFPFSNGYTKVIADTKSNAIKIFEKEHTKNGKYASVYSKEEFFKACSYLQDHDFHLKEFTRHHETLYQYQLTKEEYDELKSLEEEWDYLARDDDGGLFAYDKEEPAYSRVQRAFIPIYNFKPVYDDYFKFINSDRPLEIYDILQNCEVIG